MPNELENRRFNAIEDIVNEEVARFLRSLLDSYCSFLLLNEYKLSREKTGNILFYSLLSCNTKSTVWVRHRQNQ